MVYDEFGVQHSGDTTPKNTATQAVAIRMSS
jgi:hypothetical protein